MTPRFDGAAAEAVREEGGVPFDRADAYRQLGWTGAIPLPPNAKWPPPPGVTGETGRWPSNEDLEEWRRSGYRTRGDNNGGLVHHEAVNLGLRLPPVVLGLDVDNYDDKTGAATLAEREAAWGPLPATWRATSRDDGISGIALFRVPPKLCWPTDAGPGIEVIRYGHRYVVAPPSQHPEDRTYRWIGPDGAETVMPPRLGDLPELPVSWVMGLTGGGCRRRGGRGGHQPR